MSEHLESKYPLGKSTSEEEVRRFHRERRMFVIKDDDLMQNTVRGSVLNGQLVFYAGWDFRLDEDIERKFFRNVRVLLRKLNEEGIVVRGMYGGLTNYPGEKWFLPRKGY